MAKGLLISTTVALVGIGMVLLLQGSSAQEEIRCLDQELNMTEAQMNVLYDCLKESKIPSIWKIPMEKVSCFGVCVLHKKNLLTNDGKLDHDRIYKYIQDVMKPDSVKKPLVDGVEKCIKDHGDVIERKAGDPHCTQFMETGMCVHDVFLDICVK